MYHLSVRKKKKLAESIRAEQLFEAGKLGDFNLLKQMKNIRGGKGKHNSFPDNIDTASGPEEISELFKSVYEKLYNSSETSAAMKEIKLRLRSLINSGSMVEVNKVVGSVLKEAPK